MDITCYSCGGTGQAYDHVHQGWVKPIQDCPACKGTGKVDYCEANGHIPNRTGMCAVCGYEAVTEVDDDGEPVEGTKL